MFKKLWNKITGKEEHPIKEQSQEIEQQQFLQESSEQDELMLEELKYDQSSQEESSHKKEELIVKEIVVEKAVAEKATIEVAIAEHEITENATAKDIIAENAVVEDTTIGHIKEDSIEYVTTDDIKEGSVEDTTEDTTTHDTKENSVEDATTHDIKEDSVEEITLKENNSQEYFEEEHFEKVDFEQAPTLEEEQLEQDSALEEEQFEQDSALEEEQKPKKGFFKKLFEGLDKTRKNITDKIDNLINNYGKIDDELFDELEEILIMSDISMDTSLALIASLREELVKRKITDASLVKSTLRDVIVNFLNTEEEAKISDNYPTIILVIGVNGAGKTTTIGKLANKYKTCGKSVILAAADTFRAAAIDQLQVWGNRSGVRVIAHSEGSDPSAVIFDAINAAKSSKTDILICDTAGRLHNKVNLMNELNKMFRIIEREYPEANKEVLIVLDATTGQNALNQAKLFKEVADITGLVLTKLDGAAKGGFVLSIKHDLGIPLKLIGVGEGIDDLQEFKPVEFANALMDLEQKSEA